MKHKISLPRRAAAFALAFLLVLPNAYAAAGEQKLQTSTQIAQGLTYRNTVTVNDGSRVESFSFELSPDSPVRPILWQGSETIYTSATINWAVSTAQAAGYHVVGGVNTDFFNMSNGVPEGVVVEDGVYKSSAEGTNALAFTGNRAVLLEAPEVVMTVHNDLRPEPGLFRDIHPHPRGRRRLVRADQGGPRPLHRTAPQAHRQLHH